jgi:hypothetical protein
METKQTLKTCNTQKLFILNELSKTVDLNLFDKIYFYPGIEKIQLSANYRYLIYELLKNKYGKPKTYFFENFVHVVFDSETITFVLMIEDLKQ